MKTLRILKKSVGQKPEVIEVEHTLDKMQELVGGGYIEIVRLGENIALVIDEEGKLNGSKPNFDLVHDVVMGDCFFVAEGFVDGEIDFISLTDEQINMILNNGAINFDKEPENEPDVSIGFYSW